MSVLSAEPGAKRSTSQQVVIDMDNDTYKKQKITIKFLCHLYKLVSSPYKPKLLNSQNLSDLSQLKGEDISFTIIGSTEEPLM